MRSSTTCCWASTRPHIAKSLSATFGREKRAETIATRQRRASWCDLMKSDRPFPQKADALGTGPCAQGTYEAKKTGAIFSALRIFATMTPKKGQRHHEVVVGDGARLDHDLSAKPRSTTSTNTNNDYASSPYPPRSLDGGGHTHTLRERHRRVMVIFLTSREAVCYETMERVDGVAVHDVHRRTSPGQCERALQWVHGNSDRFVS